MWIYINEIHSSSQYSAQLADATKSGTVQTRSSGLTSRAIRNRRADVALYGSIFGLHHWSLCSNLELLGPVLKNLNIILLSLH